jgi:hypothetical protein
VLEACHLYASEAGPRAHVEVLKIGRLRSVPINGFPKLFDEASAAIERLTWLDRYRTAASLPNCPGSDQIRPVGHFLLGVPFLAGWSAGGFAGSLMSCCDKTRRNSRGGPTMNVTLASAAFSPVRPAHRSRPINRIHVRTIAGSCMAASYVMTANHSSPKKVAQ